MFNNPDNFPKAVIKQTETTLVEDNRKKGVKHWPRQFFFSKLHIMDWYWTQVSQKSWKGDMILWLKWSCWRLLCSFWFLLPKFPPGAHVQNRNVPIKHFLKKYLMATCHKNFTGKWSQIPVGDDLRKTHWWTLCGMMKFSWRSIFEGSSFSKSAGNSIAWRLSLLVPCVKTQ